MILLAIEDRKMRIEVGYGLEPIIPDGRAGEIRENMRPHLQAGAYDMAIATGVVELGRIIAQDAGVAGDREASAYGRCCSSCRFSSCAGDATAAGTAEQ